MCKRQRPERPHDTHTPLDQHHADQGIHVHYSQYGKECLFVDYAKVFYHFYVLTTVLAPRSPTEETRQRGGPVLRSKNSKTGEKTVSTGLPSERF